MRNVDTEVEVKRRKKRRAPERKLDRRVTSRDVRLMRQERWPWWTVAPDPRPWRRRQ